jgi:hypothetical protein
MRLLFKSLTMKLPHGNQRRYRQSHPQRDRRAPG